MEKSIVCDFDRTRAARGLDYIVVVVLGLFSLYILFSFHFTLFHPFGCTTSPITLVRALCLFTQVASTFNPATIPPAPTVYPCALLSRHWTIVVTMDADIDNSYEMKDVSRSLLGPVQTNSIDPPSSNTRCGTRT